MNQKEEQTKNMTNEEYRMELNNFFAGIHENYKLRWFYLFIIEKAKAESD